MRSVFLSLTGVFFAVLLAVSCSKEFSFESGLSKGTLKSDITGDCLPSSVNGVYRTDSVLTAANFITAQVNITTPGSYFISSDTINGFSFKGEGFIDSTGLQTVLLFANGKPVAAGDYIFTLQYDTSVCTIEVSVTGSTGGTGSAEFTIATTTGTCPEVIFKGTYTVNTALDATNTMEFDVNVTKAGTYTLNVTPANGFSFSGSGIFAATGVQHVILKGSGTPTAAGTVVFSIVNGAACTYNIPVLAAANTPDAVFTLNCASAAPSGTYMEGAAMTAQNTVTITATVTTAGKYSLTTTAVNGVTFSGAGTFAAASTTPQTITLSAAGTATSRGPFSYPVSGNGSNCSFPVTYTAAPSSAVFTLNGAPGACTNALVNGAYSSGTALTASNTVVLKIDVATPGTYALTTNTINGIKFSAVGTFTNAGLQDVTLTGSGTPTAGGVSTFKPQIAASACTFDVTVVATPVATGILTCKIDGVFTAFNDRAAFKHEDILGSVQLILDGYTGPANGSTVPEFKLIIENNDGSYIKAGTYNENGFLSATGYFVLAEYTVVNADASVTKWTTSSNIFPPPNPPLTIVLTSISATRAKGTFSGKITNTYEGGTAIKTITEGVFDLPLR